TVSGTPTFASTIGDTQRVSQLTINGATTFQAAVRTNALTTTAAISNGTTLDVASTSSIGANVTTTGTQTYNGNITLSSSSSLTGGLFSFSNVTTSGAYALSLLPYSTSFTGDQSLTGLTLGATLTGLTIGASGNTADITLPNAISIAGPINIYGGAINVNNNVTTSSGDILMRASGTFTIASSKAITNSSGNTVITTSKFVNNAGSTALSNTNSGASKYWQVWSTNADPYNGSTGDTVGSLAYDYKQYNINYGASPSGTGRALLYSYAPTLTFSLTGTVSKTYDGYDTATLTSSNYSVSGAVNSDSITYNKPTSGTYDTKNVGTSKTVSVTSVTLTSVASSTSKPVYGYSVAATSISGSIGTITAATANISATKTYDGGITLTSGQVTITGVTVGANTEVLTYTGTASLSDANVATSNKYVVPTSMTLANGGTGLTTGLASNYALPSNAYNATSNRATVNTANLTVTADNQTTTYGTVI
ncbi:MAG: hypothetical protein EBX12_07750, partial [Actinobacteria bacterium]|nr:hypothetical protein [Actinomycetota bacterium]